MEMARYAVNINVDVRNRREESKVEGLIALSMTLVCQLGHIGSLLVRTL